MKKATQSSAYTTLLASISLEHHILAECLAMAKHAFSSGLPVPGRLTERLDAIAALELGEMSSTENPKDPNDQRGDHSKELAMMHARLSEIVKPATPRTILLMATETAKAGIWKFLGPVPLIRGMTGVAVTCLVAFVAISLTHQVNTTSIAKSIFENEGIDLLLNLTFLMTAAGLGACFAALFQANRYIAEGTFDPKYESSYWIRFVLGLMAGLMLTQLIPMEGMMAAGGAAAGGGAEGAAAGDAALNVVGKAAEAVNAVVKAGAEAAAKAARTAADAAVEELKAETPTPSADVVAAGAQAAANLVRAVEDAEENMGKSGSSTAVFIRPTLAMLGGFSAALVYRILNRLIEAVESLVRGETREVVAAQEQAAEARFAEQSTQSRMQLAGSLTKLQQRVSANADPAVVQQELDRILGRLIPADEGEEEMESAPASQTQA